MRLYVAGARLPFSLSDTLAPCVRTRHARRICLLVVPWPAANESWTEPEGVACRLYKSGVVLFGVNLGWPKKMERTTKRTLAKSAVEAVRTH